MRRRRRPTVRDAARASRRDLRILLLIAAVFLGIFLVVQPGSGSAEAPAPPPEDHESALEEFDPTEKISADRAIAFPVDI